MCSCREKMPSLPSGTIEKARRAGYNNVLKLSNPLQSSLHVFGIFAAVSFFCTPAGISSSVFCLSLCCGLQITTAEEIQTNPMATFLYGTVCTAVLSILTFVPFARWFDRFYQAHPQLRCQGEKTHNVETLARSEVYLAVGNLCLAAVLTSLITILYFTHPGVVLIYTDFNFPSSIPFVITSTISLFLWIDLWAYFSHRILHIPFLYLWCHKVHHAYRQPTAFSGLGLHPVDMIFVQGGVFLGLFFIPTHISSLIVNLLYVHFHNVVDHSGVYFESWFPWQPSSLYHDDHHNYFHVNYGQTLTIWDRLGNTFYLRKKKYTEESFSW